MSDNNNLIKDDIEKLPLPEKDDYFSMAMLVGIELTKPTNEKIINFNKAMLVGIELK